MQGQRPMPYGKAGVSQAVVNPTRVQSNTIDFETSCREKYGLQAQLFDTEEEHGPEAMEEKSRSTICSSLEGPWEHPVP